MRLLLTVFLAPLLGSVGSVSPLAAQSPAAAPAQDQPSPSALLQPPLTSLQQNLNLVHPDKWKSPAPIREATAANIASIRRDLSTTLPPLLAAADAAPGSVTSVLPVLRNMDALYDVLLRVTQESEASAPRQQSAALEESMASLEAARRTLGDRLQASAVAQEQQVRDLQSALRARPSPAPVPVADPQPVTPASDKKRKPRSKPAQKPAATLARPAPAAPPPPQN